MRAEPTAGARPAAGCGEDFGFYSKGDEEPLES